MKKTITITALVLLFLGMGIAFIALVSAGFNFSTLSVNAERTLKNFDVDYTEGTNFKVCSPIDNVKISPSEDEQIHIVCYESKYSTYELTEDNGKITLTRNDLKRNWWEYISFNLNWNDYSTVIELPASFNGELAVEAVTQNVEISGFSHISACNISITTGNVQCADLIAESMKITSTTGNINVTDVTASELTFTLTTGNIVVKNTNTETLSVKATTGDIFLDGAEGRDIYARATTGNIRGAVRGNQSEYTLRHSTTTGNCNFNDRDGNGDKYLTAETTTGSINISFSG